MKVGQHVGPFELKQELGSGAMGTVFKAEYEGGGIYAVKVISLGLTGNETALNRFEREAKILKQLKHPNIVRLFGAGRTHGMPYFAMEFVQGESLDHALARRLRFSWEEVVSIGKQVCAALQHAHEKGIIHRDLKPSNLMYLEGGTVKLTDFGIAKDVDLTALTGANSTVGTAAYMSPEQCKGESITAKSDLYSLGVVLFELLTGRKPFIAESPVDMFMKHVNEPPPRPNWVLRGGNAGEIPTWLETVVLQMMEKKPEHRPLNAEMVGNSLQEGLDSYYAGKSAAVDAVQARASDRRIQTNVVDEADREAARTLRGALKKKKIRKKSQPFYSKPLFVFLAIPPFLLAFAGVLWLVLQPPSADSLFHAAEKRMEKKEYREALTRLDEREGPIREFLRLYPNHPNAPKVREWQDLAETTLLLEKIKHNAKDPRIKAQYVEGEKINDKFQQHAFLALRYEEYGDLTYAGEHWKAAQSEAADDRDERIGKRLAGLQFERLKSDFLAAREKDPKTFADERVFRLALLEGKLEQAKKAKKDGLIKDAERIADETIELYADANDTEIAKLADQFRVFGTKKPDKKMPEQRKTDEKEPDQKKPDEKKPDEKK
jgi:serine/threonine-protein kinase